MSTLRLPQNPGIGGLEELTSAEETFLTGLAGITYSNGDILYASGGFLTNLGIGTEDQVLTSKSGIPSWEDSMVDLSGYVPYTGATADLNLGDYHLLAEGAVSHDSHGFYFKNQSLANVASFGLGGGQNWTFYDGVKLDGGTASRVLLTDASKNISYSMLTSAELEAIPTTYAKLDGSNQPFTGDITVSKANPIIKATDTGLASSTWLEKDTTLDGSRLVSQNRLYSTGNALTLAGATYGSGLSYTSTGALSVSFWWKTSNAGDSYFIGDTDASSDFRWGSGVISFQDEAAGLARYWSATSFNNNTWRMITLTISADRATVLCYVNGTLATQTQAGTVGGNFVISRIFATNGNTTGSFDDFKIYTKELSAAEVTALYNAGAPSEVSDMTSMYAYYKLNATSGTTVTDSSGNSRTVTLVGGSPVWEAGIVAAAPNPLSDIPVLRIANNTTGNSYGNLTLGYYSAGFGTTNIYEGLSHQWNYLGSSKMTLGSSGVNIAEYTGGFITTNNGSSLSLAFSGTTITRKVTLLAASDGGYISGKGSASDNLFLGVGEGASKIVTINSTGVTTSVPVLTSAGTAAAPAWTFSADPNTGVYNLSADVLGFSTAGTLRMRVDAAALILSQHMRGVDGSTTFPTYAFANNTNTGMYRPAASTIGFVTAGATRMQIGATGEVAIGTSPNTAIVFRVTNANTQLTATKTGVYLDGTHTQNADNAFQWRGIYSGPAVNQAGFNATASTSSGGAIPGFYALPQATGASGTVTNVTGFFSSARNTGAGIVSELIGFSAGAGLNTGGGSVTNVYGFYAGANTVGTNNYEFYGTTVASSGRWGFYQAGGANNYFAGNVGFGVAPSEALEVKDAGNIKFQTTTGTKIGTATGQKIGFWNATPVIQQVTNAYTSDGEGSAYTGIDNLQVGTPYAQVSDLNQLRVAYETLRSSYDDLLTKLKTTGVVA